MRNCSKWLKWIEYISNLKEIRMKALVLAGGEPQIVLINELKKREYKVLLADYNINPVAKNYADIFYQESTLDINAIKEIARNENVDLIITVCTDQALNTVAVVAEELGLPCYISAKIALQVTNKKYMKTVFGKYGIPTARFWIVDSMTKLNQLDELRFPLVIKPANCNSSKGVVRVDDIEKMEIAIKNALEMSRTRQAIVEEFVFGNELSVDAVVVNGKVVILTVSDLYKVEKKDGFVIYRAICPANISCVIFEKIKKIGQDIADAFELMNAPMLIQMIEKEGELFVIEFSARTGGGEKHHMIQKKCGINIINETVDMMLGNEINVDFQKNDIYILNEFVYCYPGIFDHLDGFEELLEDKVIDEYRILKSAGTEINSIESSGDRVASYTIIEENYEKLKSRNQEAHHRMHVINSEGHDIMCHEISQPLPIRKYL